MEWIDATRLWDRCRSLVQIASNCTSNTPCTFCCLYSKLLSQRVFYRSTVSLLLSGDGKDGGSLAGSRILPRSSQHRQLHCVGPWPRLWALQVSLPAQDREHSRRSSWPRCLLPRTRRSKVLTSTCVPHDIQHIPEGMTIAEFGT